MAELAALGAASSLITIADVAWRTLKRMNEFNDRAGTVPELVRHINRQLQIFHETIKLWHDEALRGELVLGNSDSLKTAVEGCSEAIESLIPLIEQMLPKAADSRVARFRRALKSVKIEPELKKAWDQVKSYEGTFIHLFVRPGPQQKLDNIRSKAYYLYPNRMVSRYVDRSTNNAPITTEIERYFALGNSEHRSHVVVLRGMGGSGKTQLALRYCEEARRQGRIKAIFWVDTTTPSSLANSFEEISSHLTGSTRTPDNASGLNEQPDTTTETQQTIQLIKRTLTDFGMPWLFVFDNFDQPDHFKFHGTLRSIKDYWPANGNGSILITSRHRGCERLGKTFDVGSMSVEEASQLLLSTTHGGSDPTLLDEAKRIVQLLGCLALAVDQAGAYISSQRLEFSQYSKHYKDRKEEVLKRIPKASTWEYSRQTDDDVEPIGLSVFTTWELSLECLSGTPAEKEAKIHFLSLAAFFNPSALQETLFTVPPGQSRYGSCFESLFYSGNKRDSYKFGDVITEFENLSLIDSVDRSGKIVQFTIHPLVSDWIRLRLPHDLRHEYVREAIVLLRASIPHDYKHGNHGKSIDEMLALVKHLESCVEHCPEFLAEDSCLGVGELHNAGMYIAEFFSSWGRLEKTKSICEVALRWREERQLPWDRGFLELACRLIWVLREEHDMETLKRMTLELHAKCQEILGDEDELTLLFLMHTGWMYQETGRHLAAERALQTVYNRNTQLFGSQHLSTLISRANLAILFYEIEALSKATFNAEEAYQKLLDTQGPNFSTTLMVQQFLGMIYAGSDDMLYVDKALSLTLDCSTRVAKIYGLSHPKTLRSYFQLVHIYSRKKQYMDAHRMLDAISTAMDLSRDAPTYTVAHFYWMSGWLQWNEGNTTAAHSDLENAFVCLRKLNRLYDDLTGKVLMHLTASLKILGDVNEAEKLVRETWLAYQKTGDTNYKFEEQIYWTQYWLYADLAFFKDPSKLPQVRQAVDKAISATRQLSYAPGKLSEKLIWAQTAYTHLEEPEMIDRTSLEVLSCWNNEIASSPRTYDIDQLAIREATQVALPSLVTTLCDALLEWHYYPDRKMILLYCLLRAYEDTVNAQIAAELCLTRDSALADRPHPWINCDLCLSGVPFGGKYFSCSSCKDCDLHEACYLQYQELDAPLKRRSPELSQCFKHEFIHVPRDDWKQWDYETVDKDGQTLSEWLVAIRDRYGSFSTPPHLEEFAYFELLT